MKKIIIGCPYNGIIDLRKSLEKFKQKEDVLLDIHDVSAIDLDNIYIDNEEVHRIESFSSAFIRYPYDLISPHTETYNLRETTEFLKSSALLLDKVSINKISDNFKARNRMWSLKMARQIGIEVPQSIVIRSSDFDIENLMGTALITKSLGNCYYSEKVAFENENTKKYLSIEEDGGETACIYSPHVLENDEIADHVDAFSICLIQNLINKHECRIFLVGNEIFVYDRQDLEKVDKSSGILIKTSINLQDTEVKKLFRLKSSLNLGYLCMDGFWDEYTTTMSIMDINPFGSMPQYDKHPEVVDALAHMLLEQ